MSKKDKPYFLAEYNPSGTRQEGQNSARLGHQLSDGDGNFVHWDWDGECLTIENDYFGMYPVFYYCKAGKICVSPSIETILKCGVDVSFDYRALSVFIRMGMYIQHDTPFEYIKVIPPNSIFRWQNGKLSVSQKSNSGIPCVEISRSKAVDGYIDRFKSAIAKRLPENERYAIPLSGGRDSRHIFLEFIDRGLNPKVVTHLPNPNCSDEDVRVAKLLTQATAVEHILVEQSQNRLAMELEKNRRTSFCSDESAQLMVMASYLEENGIETVYDGIAGDTFSEGNFFIPEYMDAFRSERFDQLSDMYLKYWNIGVTEDALKGVIHGEMFKKMSYSLARDYLLEELKRYKDCHNPVQHFIFQNRTRREITLSPFGILQNIQKVHCPYLDKDLGVFLMSLPLDVLRDSTFHSETIARAYPKFANIPFAKSGQQRTHAQNIINQFAKDFGWFGLKHQWRSQFVDAKYLFPRLIKGLVKPGFVWHGFWLVIYFLQLEDHIARIKGKVSY